MPIENEEQLTEEESALAVTAKEMEDLRDREATLERLEIMMNNHKTEANNHKLKAALHETQAEAIGNAINLIKNQE